MKIHQLPIYTKHRAHIYIGIMLIFYLRQVCRSSGVVLPLLVRKFFEKIFPIFNENSRDVHEGEKKNKEET